MHEKKERKVTPIGEAKWAHVHTPKAPFEGKGTPKYQIDVIFAQDNAEWSKWAKDVMDRFKALPDQIDKTTGEKIQKKSPIKRELDENDQPTGRFYVTFRTNDKFKPGVFDTFGKPIDKLVGNGSMVRVNYCENVFDGFGGGINFYLNAVQVVALIEYGNASAEAYGFPVEVAPVEESDIPF